MSQFQDLGFMGYGLGLELRVYELGLGFMGYGQVYELSLGFITQVYELRLGL